MPGRLSLSRWASLDMWTNTEQPNIVHTQEGMGFQRKSTLQCKRPSFHRRMCSKSMHKKIQKKKHFFFHQIQNVTFCEVLCSWDELAVFNVPPQNTSVVRTSPPEKSYSALRCFILFLFYLEPRCVCRPSNRLSASTHTKRTLNHRIQILCQPQNLRSQE